LSGRAVAQRRPRISKLGLKRLTNYHSNEIAVEAASGPIKGLLSQNIYSKGELDNTFKPNRIMGKRQPAREIPRIKRRNCLLLLWVMLADARC
jgi:hypothetical protein